MAIFMKNATLLQDYIKNIYIYVLKINKAFQ